MGKIGLRAGGSGAGGAVSGAGAGAKGAGVEAEGAGTGEEGAGAWERYREGGPPDLLGEQRKQRTQRREELAWPGRVESGGPL